MAERKDGRGSDSNEKTTRRARGDPAGNDLPVKLKRWIEGKASTRREQRGGASEDETRGRRDGERRRTERERPGRANSRVDGRRAEREGRMAEARREGKKEREDDRTREKKRGSFTRSNEGGKYDRRR